ncbi:MAG TPA: hypothetical protein VE085_15055 [Burkholderiales bacterium]|nr:hypothetical protein [Burkholderiales bacterium]
MKNQAPDKRRPERRALWPCSRRRTQCSSRARATRQLCRGGFDAAVLDAMTPDVVLLLDIILMSLTPR